MFHASRSRIQSANVLRQQMASRVLFPLSLVDEDSGEQPGVPDSGAVRKRAVRSGAGRNGTLQMLNARGSEMGLRSQPSFSILPSAYGVHTPWALLSRTCKIGNMKTSASPYCLLNRSNAAVSSNSDSGSHVGVT